MKITIIFINIICTIIFSSNLAIAADKKSALNASYDATRELYNDINQQFSIYYSNLFSKKAKILQSHTGSSKQTRSLLEGMPADIATLASSHDVDILSKFNLVKKDWRLAHPNKSSPYSSVILLLVRKGNPKNIKDWDDLIRDDVSVISPNPKTSGGARWNYLVTWTYAQKKSHNNFDQSKEFISKLYKNVPILDTSARGSSITFTKRNIGDVLIAWESEALMILNNKGGENFEIIAPSLTINVKLPVVIIDKNVDKHHNRILAERYIDFLYSDEAQGIFAKHYFRPFDLTILKNNINKFAKLNNIIESDEIGESNEIQQLHFDNGALFDQICG
jgi:sulfate transport system substrate-binding protein